MPTDEAAADQTGTDRAAGGRTGGRHMSSAASFLRRVTPSRPFTAIVPRSARYTARQAAAAAAAANRTAPAHLPTGGQDAGGPDADTANTRGTIYGRNNDPARPRRLLLGAGALFTIAALLVVAMVRDGIGREPIRGEFAAGVPNVDAPAFGADSPSPDVEASADASADASANGTPVGDPAASGGAAPDIGIDPGVNPNPHPGTGDAPGPAPATTTPSAGNMTPPAAPTTPATVPLTPGSRVGLEVAAMPGHRIRHRDSIAVVEPVDADSRSKTDAAFVVRPGLASRSCVSFESANVPGYYLRHRGFRIFLDRIDDSSLFRADTTFCPVTGIGGRHTSFKSYNYPDRFLRHDTHKQMRISPIGDGSSPASATFLIRPPL
ncbi:AbfB domain-containing protein [Micromonospora sp. LOL_023]|uniref:AbfB domain-containing protein n=1 Tax=Micromonospora sp. LOL_023 TaxID=3345418 RepID=UPI003A8BAB1C